jgi:hypothetical protein
MNRTCRTLLAVLAIALLAAPSFAQDPLASKVTVDLKAVSPDQAFRVVGNTIGMKVAVDAAVTTPIDILVKDVSARTALTTMCESIGCRWTVSANTITVKPRDEISLRGTVAFGNAKSDQARVTMDRIQAALKQTLPAGMKFENAPLADVNARLSDALDLKVELISDDPKLRTLTADFSNQSLLEALKVIFPPGDRSHTWRIGISDRSAGDKSPAIMLGIRSKKK